MTTFNELATRMENVNSELEIQVSHQLWRADRPYQERDGRHVYNGNYLEDFLTWHGEETIRPILFKPGCPAGRGEGVVFVE